MNAINGSFTGRKRIRKSFGRIPEVAPMPNLIDVQRASYEAFLQSDVKPDNRTHTGLQEVFKSVFPIDDFAGRGRLEFVYYELEEPKYDVEECIQRGMTYAAPLKVTLRLIVWDVGPGETCGLPTKWMSGDGKTLHLVFSGDDCFSVRRATLTVAE